MSREAEVVVVGEVDQFAAAYAGRGTGHAIVHREKRIDRITCRRLGQASHQGAVFRPLVYGASVRMSLSICCGRQDGRDFHADAVHRIGKLTDGRGAPEQRGIHAPAQMTLECNNQPGGRERIQSVIAQAGVRARRAGRQLELVAQPLQYERQRWRRNLVGRCMTFRRHRLLAPIHGQHGVDGTIATLLHVAHRVIRPGD